MKDRLLRESGTVSDCVFTAPVGSSPNPTDSIGIPLGLAYDTDTPVGLLPWRDISRGLQEAAYTVTLGDLGSGKTVSNFMLVNRLSGLLLGSPSNPIVPHIHLDSLKENDVGEHRVPEYQPIVEHLGGVMINLANAKFDIFDTSFGLTIESTEAILTRIINSAIKLFGSSEQPLTIAQIQRLFVGLQTLDDLVKEGSVESPTLTHLARVLETTGDPDAVRSAEVLNLLSHSWAGGLFEDGSTKVAGKPSDLSVKLRSGLVGFDYSGLKSSESRSMAQLILRELIAEAQSRPDSPFFAHLQVRDEIWSNLEDPVFASMEAARVRKIRSAGTWLLSSTQSVDEFIEADNPAVRSMLNEVTSWMLFKINNVKVDKVQSIIGFGDHIRNQLPTLSTGECIIYYPKGAKWVRVRLDLTPSERRMFQTNQSNLAFAPIVNY